MNVSFVSSQDIIDGINKTLKNKTDAVINIINDKLTVSVFALLEQNLRNVKEINFIIRDSRYLPKGEEVSREFEININDVLFNSYDITEKNKLQHFYQAKAMHNFIKKHVNVKRVTNACSVKSNLICIDDNFMFTGQSSLEMPDKRNSSVFAANFDAIVTDNDETGKEQIARCSEMFNQLWYNEQFTVSYKEQLLDSLHFVYKEHSPELLYYFTLNELFGNQLDQGVERFERDSDKFKKTEIWNALYDFQKDCVVSAIRKLQKYRGCIIADSVGLGKTFEALAVIKYFEIAMDRVLVLTPAKLYDNWNSFRGDYKDSFLHESFNYRIMFHTDLSRYKGMSRSGQDLKKFDLGLYDLVVIDESHNFRNRTDRYDENDQLVMTRYARLMQDVIKHGNNNTKVLLLSATPVNNSLVDLKNQISIITRDEDYAFEDESISSVENLLRKSSQVINTWEKKQNHTKDELLNDLPSDFYKLLEIMTISRSRKHIMNYYANGDVGTFPEKNKPITMQNNISAYIVFSIEDRIGKMSFHCPELNYIHPTSQALTYKFQADDFSSHGTASVSTEDFDSTITDKTTFVVDEKNIDVYFSTNRTISFKDNHAPIIVDSVLVFSFDPTDDYEFIYRLWKIARDFIRYLCYRKDVFIPIVTLSKKCNDGEYQECAILHTGSQDEEPDLATLKKGKYIKQKYISGKEGAILSDIASHKLYLRHIPESYESGRHIDAARFVMITAAFEWEFKRAYKYGIIKSQTTIDAENQVDAEISKHIEDNTGKKKEIYKFLKKNIRSNSLASEIVQVGKDYSNIIDVFGAYKYKLNHQTLDYSEMGDRLSKQRNSFAHGNLEQDFIGYALLDLIFLENILYAMQLKHYNISDIDVKMAINDLFKCNIAIKDSEQ